MPGRAIPGSENRGLASPPAGSNHVTHDGLQVVLDRVVNQGSQARQVWDTSPDVLEVCIVGIHVTLEGNLCLASRQLDNQFCQAQDRNGLVTANVDNLPECVVGFHQCQHAADHVVDMGKAANLLPIVVNHQRLSGDGCFLMNGQELATAAQYGLNVTFIVVNNGMYGTIRMHQERRFPKRVSGTDLVNPDFAALARSYGLQGEMVDKTEDFAGAYQRARDFNGPALIELRVDQEAITPAATISGIREAALKN